MQRMVIRLDGGASGERTRVRRNDTTRLDKVERLANGALRIDAIPTKSGVFVYHDSQGQEVREWRPPAEVHKADSLRSLRDAPVTLLHPPGLVTPENWKQYSIGHVSGDPIVTESGPRASVIVSDAKAIAGLGTDIKECSCGYELWVEDSAGTTPEGERYDKIQRDITYNHLALGPEGWGRQGASVSLRLDSAGNQVSDRGEQTMQKITIVFDGKTYTVDAGSQEHTDLLNKVAARQAEYDTLVRSNKELTAKVDAFKGECDALKKEAVELKTKLDAAPALAREQATARLKLEGEATEVLGKDFKADGKDDNAVRVEIIAKFDPDFKFDAKTHSADYVRAMSDTYLKRGSGDLQTRMARDAADPPNNTRRDDKRDEFVLDANDPDVEGARRKMNRDNANASRGFAVSKNDRA
jgi:hypothetical protein